MLVLDELAVYRSGLSKRSKLMTQVAKKFRWVWGMTGAPTPNSQLDVWGQARIITPARVNDRFTHFRDELMIKVSDFKWLPKKDATDRAFAALQPAVRYTLDDVVELPEVLPPRLIQVGMGKEQARVYDELRKHAYVLVKNKEITAMNAGVVLMKLLLVSSGYVYSKESVVELDNGARLQALEDLILSTDRKVIVFAPVPAHARRHSHALEQGRLRCRQPGKRRHAADRAKRDFQPLPEHLQVQGDRRASENHGAWAHAHCRRHGDLVRANHVERDFRAGQRPHHKDRPASQAAGAAHARDAGGEAHLLAACDEARCAGEVVVHVSGRQRRVG